MTPPVVTSTRVVHGTIVFTDIVGFTEYNFLRGDDDALALLATQERIVRDALPAQARIVKELGDGLLLWFSDACEAVRTALVLQERFEHQSMESDVPLWVRCGMHSGQQTRRGEDLVGHSVNLSARIVDLAGPGEVLLSEATKDEVDEELPDVSFEELGPVLMKGIPEPVRLFRAASA
jgi:class 3 adenylate cyclase